MKKRALKLSFALIAIAPVVNGTTVVHWGATSTATNYSQNLSVGKNVVALDLDNESNPTPGGAYYPDTTDATPVFYGASLRTYDVVTGGGFTWRVEPTNPGSIAMNVNTGIDSDPLTTNIQGVYVWKKEDFLNGGDANPVTLNDISLSTTVNGGSGSLRFVLQNGSDWYVSDATSSLSISLSSFTTNWYYYDPETDFTDFTGSNAGVSIADFTDVSSVGLWLSKTSTGRYTIRSLRSITVDATVVPEPSTYALIGGALALGVVMLRRRR